MKKELQSAVEAVCSRRAFVAGGVGVLLSSDWKAFGATVASDRKLSPRRVRIDVGATAPFTALHVSDTHFPFLTESDRAKYPAFFRTRERDYYPEVRAWWAATLKYAKDRKLPLLHTGDFVDFPGEANLTAVREAFAALGPLAFCCAGNHEFCNMMSPDDEPGCRAITFPRVKPCYPNDLVVASRVINGVNFVAFDDVYYNCSDACRSGVHRELAKKLPTVLMLHVPIYEEGLYRFHCERCKSPNALGYMIAAPKAVVSRYEPRRIREQTTNAETLAFIEELRANPYVRAVLAGHLHYPYRCRFSPTAEQFIAGGNYEGDAWEFTFT